MKKVSVDYIKDKIKIDKGYKIFYSDWDTLFSNYNNPVGCVYIEEEPIKICQKGLHYCNTIESCLSFILPKKGIHICEVEAYDHVIQDGDKCCTTTLYIKNEINLEELKGINYKSDNSSECSLNAYIFHCNNVNSCHMIRFSQNVYNSYDVLFSALVDNSDHIVHSRGITSSKNIDYCFQIGYSYNLNNCTNMLFCKDLQNKKNYFFNAPTNWDTIRYLSQIPKIELCKILPTLGQYDSKLFFELFPFTKIKVRNDKINMDPYYNTRRSQLYYITEEYEVDGEWLKFVK